MLFDKSPSLLPKRAIESRCSVWQNLSLVAALSLQNFWLMINSYSFPADISFYQKRVFDDDIMHFIVQYCDKEMEHKSVKKKWETLVFVVL